MPDAIVIVDQSAFVEYANKAARRLLDLKATGRQGLHWKGYKEALQLLEGEDPDGFAIMPAPTDPNTFLDIRVLPFGDDKKLVLLRDVTHFQKLETMRQDFVANVSHELRTPLTSILGYLQTLLGEPELKHEDVSNALSRMYGPAQRMQALVEDLLLLSRLDSTMDPLKGDLSPLSIASITSDTVSEISDEDHHFVLDIDQNLLLLGVEREITSAISNLIFNAVRYSPDGGEIRISWQRVPKGGRFAVEDDGIGIEPHHLPRLTERFYRADVGRSRISGGTGLGLAIVKHVLRRHDSELEIESSPNKGSTFACIFDKSHTLVTASKSPADFQVQ